MYGKKSNFRKTLLIIARTYSPDFVCPSVSRSWSKEKVYI
jgi:hypothetical protein